VQQVPYTALQTALGEQSPVLSFSMVERACALAIEERTDLDWKSQLPLTSQDAEGKRSQQAELAKDIAAMANSGGGLIVYGVQEVQDPNSCAAERVEPVGLLTDLVLQQIRQVAGNLVYPPVVGLDLLGLAPDDNPAGGVLALYVPDSADAPHLVHPARQHGDYFMVPWRDGPHTQRMVERQVAAAYRAREQSARTRAQQLEDVWDASARAAQTGAVWVLAVAVPDRPAPRPRDLTLEQSRAIFDAVCRPGRPGAFSALDLLSGEPTRRGLKRFLRTARRELSTGMGSATVRARAEVHGDGTIVVACTRAGAFPRESAGVSGDHVAIADLEQVGVDLLRLLVSNQRTRGIRSSYAARIGITSATQVFRRLDGALLGQFVPFTEDQRIIGFQPVDGPILASADDETTVQTCLDLVRDAINQAGAELWTDPTTFVP
jgi:hypothetical protein